MVDIIKRIQSLEDELKSLKPQVPEAKTTIKIVQMNEDWPKIAIRDVLNENSQLKKARNSFYKKLKNRKKKWVSSVNRK